MTPEQLAGLACAAARAHRLGMVAQGAEALARFVQEFGPGAAAGDARSVQALAALFAAIVAAQERGDALGLADLLEFELAPALAAGSA